MVKIGNDWDELLKEEWGKPYYRGLRDFLIDEYKNETVYPPAEDIYNALKITPYSEVKVVILGQDPYHEPGQAQGLAFSVPAGVTLPPSLVNIFKELESDLVAAAGGDVDAVRHTGSTGGNGWKRAEEDDREPADGNGRARAGGGSREDAKAAPAAAGAAGGVLAPWARQGVLLLNTVLTVRAHQAGSHRGAGWEQFTDRVIELLAARSRPMVFVLWGANAIAKKELIIKASEGNETAITGDGGSDSDSIITAPRRHLIITAPHPSPLSAYRGFFGGRYFSRCNYFLEDNDMEPIDWAAIFKAQGSVE